MAPWSILDLNLIIFSWALFWVIAREHDADFEMVNWLVNHSLTQSPCFLDICKGWQALFQMMTPNPYMGNFIFLLSNTGLFQKLWFSKVGATFKNHLNIVMSCHRMFSKIDTCSPLSAKQIYLWALSKLPAYPALISSDPTTVESATKIPARRKASYVALQLTQEQRSTQACPS